MAGRTETLTAKLQFEGEAAIQGMGRASGAFTKMQAHAKMAKEGVQNLKKGFAGFNIAIAGAAAGAVTAVKKFADFDGQMGAVKAVLGKEAAPEFERLEKLASKLGATTEFTATQSAEAMESLARAGFNATQIMSAVPEVLAAASAEGMDLATAADIVASNIKAFQLEAKDAARVADALAFVSAKTNTNMVGLQEGMKFIAPVAKNMGIELEDTAAALGALADVGLKGTLAGTGLKNALLKIAAASKDGVVKVGKFSAQIEKTGSGGVNLSKTMFNVVSALQNIKEPTERAQASMKLLGLRGMGSAAAFDALGKNQKLVNTLFVDMRKKAKGAAKGMQEMRMDTLKGDFQLLSSAVDGFAISIGKILRDFISPFIKGGKGISESLSSAGQAITQMWGAKGEVGRAFLEQDLITQGTSKSVVQFARGFVEGIKGAVSIFKTFFSVVKGGFVFLKGILDPLGFMGSDGSGVQGFTKMAIQAAALGVSIKVATSLFSKFAAVAKGSFQVIKGVLGVAKTGIQGTVQLLSSKFPKLAKVLPAGLRKLTGAAAAAEKITAQPVRVVNFDEMGGIRPGTAPGQLGLFGEADDTGVGGAKKKITRLGKAARAAGQGVGLLAAAVAGWQIGKALDEATNLSGGLANLAWNLSKDSVAVTNLMRAERLLMQQRLAVGGARQAGTVAQQQAKMFADMAARGVKIQENPKSDKKVAVTQELAKQKIALRFKGESREVREALMRAIEPILAKLPTKADLAKRPPTVIQIDGREVARAVAGTGDENLDRGGTGLFAAPQLGPTRGPKPRRASKR
jgi:TP901 family phage tail tape measure protein